MWPETSLPTLLYNYDLKDIYNADEFGLFYQCVPNKTYQPKSEKCSGGKLSKAGISAENQDTPIAEEDHPFKHLQNEIDALRTV